MAFQEPWRQLGRDRLHVRALINCFLQDLPASSANHQKQHVPVLVAGQDVSSQQDVPLLATSESSKSMGLLCQTQHCGWVREPTSWQHCPCLLLPHSRSLHQCSWKTFITELEAHALAPPYLSQADLLLPCLYPPLILPALNPNLAVHPNQSQDMRGVFYWALYPGSSHPEPPSDPSSSQIFTLRSPSLASRELQMEEVVTYVCMCPCMHNFWGLFLSNPLSHSIPLGIQRAVTRDRSFRTRCSRVLCSTGPLQPSDKWRSFPGWEQRLCVGGNGLSLSC